MKRLLLALAFLLGGSLAFAQSGGSSAAGGGLSTKAILALENCFDDFDDFICSGTGTVGPGTTDRIAKFTAATTVGNSNLIDTGMNLSGTYGGTVGLTSTGDMTFTTSDEMFLTATSDINIPDDVELIFGTTGTVGTETGVIVWNTFGGAGVERLEITGGSNAGVLIEHGSTTLGVGGFNACFNDGTFSKCLTANPKIAAGASGPSYIMTDTSPTSMDDAADQRVGLNLDFESGATDPAGAQQIGVLIESPTARASTQDAIVMSSAGWDNLITVGDETNRTSLNWASQSGANVVTVPADTGTILLDGGVTGTTNQITKFTSATSVGDSNMANAGVPAASSSGDVVSLSATLNNPGASNEVDLLSISPTLTSVTAGTASLVRLEIGDAGDGSEIVYGLVVDRTSTDIGSVRDLFFEFDSQPANIASNNGLRIFVDDDLDFDEWSLALQQVTATQGTYATLTGIDTPTMDGGDTVTILTGSVSNANHTGTGNVFAFLQPAQIVEDADATEIAVRVPTGYDYFLSSQVRGVAVADNPPANEVGLFVDESTDRVGGASADCAIVARLSDGTEINVAILVTDGGCP